MDHRAIDTEMVYVHEHLLMPADDPGLWWLVSKLRQPSFTSHRKWLARESLWIQLPPRTVLLPQKSPFGGEQHCDHHRPLVEEHSGRHQPWKAGALVWIQCQTCVICWRLTFGVWAMVVLWPQLDVADLEVKFVQWQYRHGSVSLAVEPLYFALSHRSAPGLHVAPPGACPNCLLRFMMTRWTIHSVHFGPLWSPDRYRHHPAS